MSLTIIQKIASNILYKALRIKEFREKEKSRLYYMSYIIRNEKWEGKQEECIKYESFKVIFSYFFFSYFNISMDLFTE